MSSESKHRSSADGLPPLSGEQMAALLDTMIEGIGVFNDAGKLLHFNRAALKIMGLPAEELTQRTLLSPKWRVVREDLTDLPADDLPPNVALRTGLPQNNQIIGIHQPSGEVRWVDVTATPLLKDGKAYQVLVTFRDITEARLARLELESLKDRLEKRERFLDATLSSLPCLVSYIDPKYTYRYVNKTYEEWFGNPAESFLGKSVVEVLGEKGFEQSRPFLEQTLKGYEQRYETEIPYTHGGSRFVQVTHTPDKAPNGRIQGIYTVVQDITSQIRAAKDIEKKENAIQKVINGVHSLIGYWDRDLKNVYANRAYAEYFGKDPSQIRGKHIRDVIGSVLYEKNLPYIEPALQGISQNFQRSIPTPNGSIKETLASYIPDVVDGKVQGFFVIVTDITEVKAIERERQQMEAKLIASSRLSTLGEMAAGLAHEINNPLTVISGLSAKIKSAVEKGNTQSAELQRSFDLIQENVRRAARIVRGLKAFSGDADRAMLKVVSIGQILQDTIELCQERFKNHGVALRLPSLCDCNAEIQCKPEQITQILFNLLNNSFDAVQKLEEKWVEVKIYSDNSKLTISVIDSGPGIALEIRDKLMQPFFTTKPVGKGTGLGLSISKGLAESNGGTLNYNGQEQHTCFELSLPLTGKTSSLTSAA